MTPARGRRFYRAVMFTPTNLVFIPPGTFRMGSATNEVDRIWDEGPQTVVTLRRGFFIGKYEVTQGEYQAVIGSNPSYFLDLSRPVDSVSWDNATNYCAKLSQQELAAGTIPAGSQYRLPTEAEWEYACRGLTSTRFHYGDDPGYANLTAYAWFGNNATNRSHAVGYKLPNAWGLYDMTGNLWEWCQDWWGYGYPGGKVIDPRGASTGYERIIRGGSWEWGGRMCRPAQRSTGNPQLARPHTIGFRVVLSVPY